MHFITKILLITVSLLQPVSATNMNFFNPQYGVDYAFGSLCEQQTFLELKTPSPLLFHSILGSFSKQKFSS